MKLCGISDQGRKKYIVGSHYMSFSQQASTGLASKTQIKRLSVRLIHLFEHQHCHYGNHHFDLVKTR